MIKQELVAPMENRLQSVLDKGAIKDSFLAEGWHLEDIEDTMDFVLAQSMQISFAENPGMSGSLPSFKELLSESWEIYKARFKTLIGISLLPYLIVSIFLAPIFLFNIVHPGFLPTATNSPKEILNFIDTFIPLAIALNILSWFFQLWCGAALIFTIKYRAEKIGVIESYKRSWKVIGPFLIVSILVTIVSSGGLVFLFFPGIVLYVWFVFANFIVIEEPFKGMDVLLRSREYVRGRFWYIVELSIKMILCILVASIAVLLAFYAISALAIYIMVYLKLLSSDLVEELGLKLYLSFLYNPFIAAFFYLLYQRLKSSDKVAPFVPSSKTKVAFKILGIIGIIFTICIWVLFTYYFREVFSQ